MLHILFRTIEVVADRSSVGVPSERFKLTRYSDHGADFFLPCIWVV